MKRAWSITLCAIFAGVVIAVLQNKVAPCLSVLEEAFGIGMAEAGWLSSIFSVMGIVTALPAAVLTRRLGAKAACLLSLCAAGTGSVIGLLSTSYWALLLSRVVEGVGAGLICVAVPTIIAAWFPPEKRGVPTGLWSSWQFVAQALCFFFGVTITDAFGWRGMWWAGLALAGLAGAVGLVVIRMPKQPAEIVPPEVSQPGSVFRLLRQGPVCAICCAMFCFCVACFGFVTWAPSCWSATLSMDIEQANRLITLFALISIPAVLLVGILIDRVPHRPLGVVSCLGYGVMVCAAFLLPNKAALIPFAVLYPFFEGAVSTCLWTIVPQTPRHPEQTSMAIALFNLASNCGMLLGPPLAGLISERFGWHAAAIPLLATMGCGAAALTLAKERVSTVCAAKTSP